MKRLFYALALLLIASPLMAAQQTILGGSGVLWGDEKTKINSNFSELYGKLAQALLTTSSPTFVDLTLTSDLNLKDWIYFTSDDDTHYVAVAAGNNLANYILRWPTAAAGGSNYLLNFDADGTGGWTDPATFLTPTGAGGSLTLTASGFDGNLATTDDTLQEVAQKLDDLVVSGGTDDQTAAEVAFTPNGSIAATDVQAAIQEVRDEAGSGTDDQTASEVPITDAGGYFTGENVEAGMAELGAKLPSGADGQYGAWLNNNTVNPNTYSTGKWGYTVYNNTPYWCYNGTCTAIPSAGFANPMTTAGDMIKGGTSGAATRMVPGTGVIEALEATPNATGGILTYGGAAGTPSSITLTNGTGLPVLRVGTFASPTTSTGTYSLSAANSYNSSIFYNDTDTLALPAAVAGMNLCVYVTGTNLTTIDVDGSDVMVVDGTANAAGDAVTIAGVAGNFLCLVADAANHWVTMGSKGTITAL